MSARLHQGPKTELAWFVALMLVVQALLTGLSSGARAAEPAFALGVLCAQDGSATAPSAPADPASHPATDCCTFGCPMVGGAAAPLPDDTASVPVGIRLASGRPVPETRQADRSELDPRHARAPPARV